MKEPLEYYKSKLCRNKVYIKRTEQRSSMFFCGKLIFFAIAILCLCIWWFETKSVIMIGSTFCFLLIYFFMVYLDNNEINKKEKLVRINKVIEREVCNLRGQYTGHDGKEYMSSTHPFTYDIDIFGKNSLYQSINRTVTCDGANKLSEVLSHTGLGKETILMRQAAVRELEALSDYRIEHISCSHISTPFRELLTKTMPSSLNVLPLKILLAFSWSVSVANIIFLLICCLASLSITIPVLVMAGIFFFNGSISLFYFHKGNRVIQKLKFLISLCESYSPIISLNRKEIFKSQILCDIQEKNIFHSRHIRKAINMNELLNFRNNFILWFLSNATVMIDLLVLNKFVKWERSAITDLQILLENIGQLDAFISLATFNFNHPRATVPSIMKSGLKGVDVYHPLMKSNNAIGNDYTQEESVISIITGANMSGKSTFLRALALNIVLGNAGCKVCADSFGFNPNLKLFTSMRTQDDISNGKSYFNAEIDRLSNAIDYCVQNPHTLLILDEVLKGTNSEDKLKGSIELLEYFSGQQIMAIIATHDLGVTKLENIYGVDKYVNFCFEIELTSPIHYTYKMNRGICRNKNASYILNKMLNSKIKRK